MSESIVRKHIYFSGDVQGVGFRFRSYYIAQSLGLTGWVEMEVQGSESAIQELLARIRQQRWIDITDLEMSEIPCVEESGFHIR